MDRHQLGRPEWWARCHRWLGGCRGWWLFGQSIRARKNRCAGGNAACEHNVDFFPESGLVPQQRRCQPHAGGAICSRGNGDRRKLHPRHACRTTRAGSVMLHRADGDAEPLHHQRVLGGRTTSLRTKNRLGHRGRLWLLVGLLSWQADQSGRPRELLTQSGQ